MTMTSAISFTNRDMLLPKAHPDVVYCAVEDGAVLLLTSDEVYFGLNEVGALVWELLPPKTQDFDDLCQQLGERYPEAAPSDIRSDVEELLAQLKEQGLVVHDADERSERAG